MLAATAANPKVEEGVSQELAAARSEIISNIHYGLEFNVPDSIGQKISGTVDMTFDLGRKKKLQLDFSGDAFDGRVTVNGKDRKAKWTDEHILIRRRFLKKGSNSLSLDFTSADKALNRQEDYLYTLFVPSLARSVFPCFDQPDLKGTFTLSLHLPEGWVFTSSADSHPIPTYLFSFTAGRFSETSAERDGRTIRALYREDDPAKVAQLDKVFDIISMSIKWLEEYSGIPFPFEKDEFAALPGYQFGGMEHPGAFQYNHRRIFLGENPTPDEELTRLQLLAHETAHMWFGDLVTMKWFDDVWTKEVFANFFAAKIGEPLYPDINHRLIFLKSYSVPALSTDRTDGTHPVQQRLDNLKDAGLLYGNIIYDKAPVVMRMLEQLMGAERLRSGLQTYLKEYSYANATWDDLIRILDAAAPDALVSEFSEVWGKEKGLPQVECAVEGNELAVRQSDPLAAERDALLWKETFDVGLCLADGSIHPVTVNMSAQETRLPLEVPAGDILCVLPNYDGNGYGQFVCDSAAIEFISSAWKNLPSDLERCSALMNLYENHLMGLVSLKDCVSALYDNLAHEGNVMIASTLCSFIFNRLPYVEMADREELEAGLLELAGTHQLTAVRQQILRSLSRVCLSPAVVDRIYSIWSEHSETLLTESDYTRMAYHLAVLKPEIWSEILDTQRLRLTNPDDISSFDFVSRGCNPSPEVQKALFEELLTPAGRAVEPWAQSLLELLSCEAREPENVSLIAPGLDAVEDVKRTGDIFFPGKWINALLGQHCSQESREAIKSWLDSVPSDYQQNLLGKIKESTWYKLSNEN